MIVLQIAVVWTALAIATVIGWNLAKRRYRQ
jgi:hypothetical protein